MNLPTVETYGNYSTTAYGAHALCFTDGRGYSFYFSYATCVAFRTPDAGLVVRRNAWGPTTGKHLNWIDGGGAQAKRDRVDGATFKAMVSALGGVPVGVGA